MTTALVEDADIPRNQSYVDPGPLGVRSHTHQRYTVEPAETHTLPGTPCFPSARPFVDYFASSRALIMRTGHTEAEWAEVLDFARAEPEAAIAAKGHLDVARLAGAFVAVKGS